MKCCTQAHELSLRIPHLAIRMREHSARALYLAERLEAVRVTTSKQLFCRTHR